MVRRRCPSTPAGARSLTGLNRWRPERSSVVRYRGRVEKVNPDKSADIFYVDFGNVRAGALVDDPGRGRLAGILMPRLAKLALGGGGRVSPKPCRRAACAQFRGNSRRLLRRHTRSS